ncbi:hypothetical protein [Nissabacter sp. SGAir0207]|uniref:hypothetical protein n=1 Tax=Nissabacter sp. SGAir0207 TaxID=2126321 RepID=UPI0010CCE1AE|nr:hypothetical protein [Nissabacter sp. SGAir0207]QCR35989.1 hypothetical protein C1N62_07765 [Nissabacter sp. SGAir0207]
MSERPDHNAPFPDDHENHGLPEDAPHVPNPYEEDDIPVNTPPDEEGEIPRKRDDSDDDKEDPYQVE